MESKGKGQTKGSQPRKPQKGSSDLLTVISSLEAYRVVYEAEAAEIERDLKLCEELTSKYGEHWKATINHLRQLKVLKQNSCKDIQFQLDLFKLHLQQGKDLCRRLQATGQEVKVVHAAGSSADQFEIEVNSPILSKTALPPPLDADTTTIVSDQILALDEGLARIGAQQTLLSTNIDPYYM